jgi:hypothetical protein
MQEKEEREERKRKAEEERIMTLHEKEGKSQRDIMDTLLEFKFEYLDNEEKAREQEKERKDPIDIKEEFRAIHSENLMTIKRIMADCHMEVVQPLITIQEGIERNLTEIPENTRNILEKVSTIERDLEEKEEEELKKVNTITTLSTMNLIQTNENRKAMDIGINEIRSDVDELKLSIRELGLRVIEFGSSQGKQEEETKDWLNESTQMEEEEEIEKKQSKILKYKIKRPPSESSSSSSSSDDENRDRKIGHKKSLKSRRLITPNVRTNNLDIEFIKKALMETKNGKQFARLLEEKSEFTKVHKMEIRQGNQDIYEVLKDSGCLPMPCGMQYPYHKLNYYNGEESRIHKKLARNMESTNLIKNNNNALNILLNVYGDD